MDGNDNMLLLVAVLVAILAVVAIWLWTRRSRSQHLEKHFGPEYHREVARTGSRDKAEAELMARQKRVEDLHIVPLAPTDAQRFTQQWRAVQARFVDNPRGALAEADQLVRDLMQRRGYPMAEFEQRAADISVHHPQVVEHYRAAHLIADGDRRGEVDTEGLRQAVIHYRALFAELLETRDDGRDGGQAHHQGMRTQS